MYQTILHAFLDPLYGISWIYLNLDDVFHILLIMDSNFVGYIDIFCRQLPLVIYCCSGWERNQRISSCGGLYMNKIYAIVSSSG